MKSLVEKQIGPDVMLYDGEEDSVHILNPAARMICEMHRKGLQEEEMENVLRDHFAVPPGQDLMADIRETIRVLDSRGLGGTSSAPGSPSGAPGA